MLHSKCARSGLFYSFAKKLFIMFKVEKHHSLSMVVIGIMQKTLITFRILENVTRRLMLKNKCITATAPAVCNKCRIPENFMQIMSLLAMFVAPCTV